MTLQEALLTRKKFRHPDMFPGDYICYRQLRTGNGEKVYLVDVIEYVEDGLDPEISTSLDLYPENILRTDWEVLDE